MGRRVYLALAVVLVSGRHAGQIPAAGRVCAEIQISLRTLQRWRQWWQVQFPVTPLWRAVCARFMPPVSIEHCPASLLERFAGNARHALLRLLVFLSPLTVSAPDALPINLSEGC